MSTQAGVSPNLSAPERPWSELRSQFRLISLPRHLKGADRALSVENYIRQSRILAAASALCLVAAVVSDVTSGSFWSRNPSWLDWPPT